jgi:hypothetical protein
MSSFKKFSVAQGAPRKIMGLFKGAGDKSKNTSTTDQPATQPGKTPAAAAADQPPAPQPKNTLAEDMAKYGITRVPVDYYHHGVFRYTSLKDALAQARRAAPR